MVRVAARAVSSGGPRSSRETTGSNVRGSAGVNGAASGGVSAVIPDSATSGDGAEVVGSRGAVEGDTGGSDGSATNVVMAGEGITVYPAEVVLIRVPDEGDELSACRHRIAFAYGPAAHPEKTIGIAQASAGTSLSFVALGLGIRVGPDAQLVGARAPPPPPPKALPSPPPPPKVSDASPLPPHSGSSDEGVAGVEPVLSKSCCTISVVNHELADISVRVFPASEDRTLLATTGLVAPLLAETLPPGQRRVLDLPVKTDVAEDSDGKAPARNRFSPSPAMTPGASRVFEVELRQSDGAKAVCEVRAGQCVFVEGCS